MNPDEHFVEPEYEAIDAEISRLLNERRRTIQQILEAVRTQQIQEIRSSLQQ